MYEKYLNNFKSNPGLSAAEIIALKLPESVPPDYVEFLKQANGGEGGVGEETIVIYKAQDLGRINRAHRVAETTPDLFIFGSNGSTEALAFDFRGGTAKYVLVPFILEYDAVIVLGESFEAFLDRVSKKGFFG